VFRHSIALGTTFAGWSEDLGSVIQQDGFASWYREGIIPNVTWQPKFNNTLAVINAGTYDAYIKKSADEVKAFGHPIFMRPFDEFNGDWMPWDLYYSGADSAADTAFIEAWQRVVNIFRQEGATNVKWVWSFNNFSDPAGPAWNNPAAAYPGDNYVDWIGVTAFNRGSSTNGLPWQSYDIIFNKAYQSAIASSPNKPVMLVEFSSNEYGDGGAMKAAWISQMMTESETSNPYPNLRAVVWFESSPHNPQYVWQTASSQPVYNAFVNGIRATMGSNELFWRSDAAALWDITTP
jgi:beta-mannanase